jgi:NCAIR mutase (PurE)-related protein
MANFNHDNSREHRLGFPEVIYGREKTVDDLKRILKYFSEQDKNVLITKLQSEKAEILLKLFPEAFFDSISGIFILKKITEQTPANEVGIISAGTSDIHIVNESYFTLAFMGIWATRLTDIGIAGIHRLTEKSGQIKKFKVLIVVAGFEGLLPSVMGGLFPQPIIAVPSDVGYGVAEGGKTALNSMLASCANGITVVNISNGYGAAMAAFRILNLSKV